MATIKDFTLTALGAGFKALGAGFKSPVTIPKALFKGIGFVLSKIGNGFAFMGTHKLGTSVVAGSVLGIIGGGTWAKEHKLAKQEAEMNDLQNKITVSQMQMAGFENPEARSDNLANLQARDAAAKTLAAAGTTR